MPIEYQSGQIFVDLMRQKENHFDFKVFFGLLCSGDSFVADEELTILLQTKFPQVLALDMESCGIAQTCHQLNIPFFCIRGISDKANKDASQSFKDCLILAMNNASRVLFALLPEL